MNRILMAGGGSLGSVSPLLAIAEHFPEANYLFLVTKKGPERKFLEERGITVKVISAGKLRRYFSFNNFLDLFKVIGAFFQALLVMRNFKPDIVLTAGGYVAVPVALAAWLWRKPIIVHQQDLEVGLANRLMIPLADTVTVAFPELTKTIKARQVVHTGNPQRQLAVPVNKNGKAIVIMGGSQGARGLNELVNKLIPDWVKQRPVIHILGHRNYNQRLSLTNNYQALKFADNELPAILAQAELVISRSGLSALTELAAFQKPVITIPMPGSHQVANAKYFQTKEAALYLDQSDETGLAAAVTKLLAEPQLRQRLAANLNTLFSPSAAANYVSLIKNKIKLNIEVQQTVYISGIGGIGTSALAQHFLHQGYQVVGSDLTNTDLTEKLAAAGVTIFYQQSRQNLPDNAKFLVHSAAVPNNNEELLEARRRHLPVYTYNQYLGELSKSKKTVAISGTNGKTTTTALAGYVAAQAGLDPTIIVGGLVPQFNQPIGNYRPGASDYLIVEACEWRSHMLSLRPQVIILTNVEEEHMDYFTDLNHIKSQFQEFLNSLPPTGLFIKNFDDPQMAELTTKARIVTYGLTEGADYQAKNIHKKDRFFVFDYYHSGRKISAFKLQIYGRLNVLNALAVLALADHLQLSFSQVKTALEDFRGSWRRFEKLGFYKKMLVYSDYAHHPTSIEHTIGIVKRLYPARKVFAIFQPHSYSRTETLFDRFSQAFEQADKVLITGTFEVAGRDETRPATDPALNLMHAINKQPIWFGQNFDQVKKIINEEAGDNDVLLFMGAGNIDILARNLADHD